MGKMRDIAGQKFGKLTAVKVHSKSQANGCYIWEFLCDCGTVTTATTNSVFSKNKRSCGCLRKLNGRRTIPTARPQSKGLIMVSVWSKPENVSKIKDYAKSLEEIN